MSKRKPQNVRYKRVVEGAAGERIGRVKLIAPTNTIVKATSARKFG
jgi:hypothetical protein